MAVTADLNAQIEFSGDVVLKDIYSWAQNTVSPGQVEVQDPTSGNNTITVPTGGSSTIAGVIIIPPSSNTIVITLKGVNGDTGITLDLVDPTIISLGTAVTSFVINVASNMTGMRFIFF